MQRDPHFDPSLQVRLQLSQPAAEKRMNGVISNGREPRCRSIVGSVVLRILDVAARAPRDHLARLGARQLFHRARAHASGHLGVAGLELRDTATMARSAHHLVS